MKTIPKQYHTRTEFAAKMYGKLTGNFNYPLDYITGEKAKNLDRKLAQCLRIYNHYRDKFLLALDAINKEQNGNHYKCHLPKRLNPH